MASSIYIFDDMETFDHFYKGYTEDKMRRIKIVDMYVQDKNKLYIVTNTNDQKEKPEMRKSLVHFRNGKLGEYENEGTELIKYEKIKFNRKKMKLEFNPRFLRKPSLSWRVDRYLDAVYRNENKLIDYNHRYYDFERDRIILILKND
jgi:hypothetical protein